MPIDFAAILCEHGFVAGSGDLYDTLTAFDYEISDMLHDDDSPFDMEKSEIRRQPDDLNCLLSCSLLLKAGAHTDNAIGYLIDKWRSWLRYQDPVYENIELDQKADGVTLRILTISGSGQTACSIGFEIKSPMEVPYE